MIRSFISRALKPLSHKPLSDLGFLFEPFLNRFTVLAKTILFSRKTIGNSVITQNQLTDMKEDTTMEKNLPAKKIENGISYTLHGDYYLPDITLSEDETKPIGRWGREHKHYLEENRSGLYTRLILSGRLYSTLHELGRQAQERYELIISQMKAAEGITETLKARNQMEWVRRMNSIRNQAEEIIQTEMIYI